MKERTAGTAADDEVPRRRTTRSRSTPTPRRCSGTRPTSPRPASPPRRRRSPSCFADAEKLTDKSKQQYGLGVDGTDIWNVAPYIWSQGGAFTNASYTQATGLHEQPRRPMAAVQMLVNLEKAGVIGSDFLGGAGAVSGEEGFPKGQYAMYIDGPWAVSTYAGAQARARLRHRAVPVRARRLVLDRRRRGPSRLQGRHHLADAEKFAAVPRLAVRAARDGEDGADVGAVDDRRRRGQGHPVLRRSSPSS